MINDRMLFFFSKKKLTSIVVYYALNVEYVEYVEL